MQRRDGGAGQEKALGGAVETLGEGAAHVCHGCFWEGAGCCVWLLSVLPDCDRISLFVQNILYLCGIALI
jgi:hypothetical protein